MTDVGPRTRPPVVLSGRPRSPRTGSVSGWVTAGSVLLGSSVATTAWIVGLFGLVWGPVVLAFVGAVVLVGTVAVVARVTGRGLLALGVSVIVPAFALLFLSRL